MDCSTNSVEFMGRKTLILAKTDRFEPEFADPFFPLNVYMFRFVAVKAEEEESIGTGNVSDSWHSSRYRPNNPKISENPPQWQRFSVESDFHDLRQTVRIHVCNTREYMLNYY